mmetsp:Transcript_20424/g.58329  ORF Transcript_20424/g.58329 Transcript_20424/m.58329 type:complete len:223 (+) Transcript_20424:335-1003(+)
MAMRHCCSRRKHSEEQWMQNNAGMAWCRALQPRMVDQPSFRLPTTAEWAFLHQPRLRSQLAAVIVMVALLRQWLRVRILGFSALHVVRMRSVSVYSVCHSLPPLSHATAWRPAGIRPTGRNTTLLYTCKLGNPLTSPFQGPRCLLHRPTHSWLSLVQPCCRRKRWLRPAPHHWITRANQTWYCGGRIFCVGGNSNLLRRLGIQWGLRRYPFRPRCPCNMRRH